MSDTPIAERLAADLGLPWPLHPPRQQMHGTLFSFFEPAAGSESGGGEPPEGCGPLPPLQGPHPPNAQSFERNPVATEQQKQQLKDLIEARKAQGQSTDAFANLEDLVEGKTQLPPEE